MEDYKAFQEALEGLRVELRADKFALQRQARELAELAAGRPLSDEEFAALTIQWDDEDSARIEAELAVERRRATIFKAVIACVIVAVALFAIWVASPAGAQGFTPEQRPEVVAASGLCATFLTRDRSTGPRRVGKAE